MSNADVLEALNWERAQSVNVNGMVDRNLAVGALLAWKPVKSNGANLELRRNCGAING